MATSQFSRLRLLSYVVIFYMLLAFSWWTILLFTKNRDAFYAKVELQKVRMSSQQEPFREKDYYNHPDYLQLYKNYRRQEWMIVGEASVFMISLVIGVWLINRGYNKEVNAAIQRRNFLLSITHELKSPIASIRLVLDTFFKRTLKPEQKNKLLESAIKETERLHKLVNDLLLSARLETAFEPNIEVVDLVKLLGDLTEIVKTKYSKASFFYQHDSSVLFYPVDRTGMTSVILNLLENAVKYGGENPSINLVLSEQNHAIRIDIKDNGIGVSDREKKKIFQKFYRIGNEDTRRTKGTGLGLFIVAQIIKSHKGQISVQDNNPKGSIFSITLPKKDN